MNTAKTTSEYERNAPYRESDQWHEYIDSGIFGFGYSVVVVHMYNVKSIANRIVSYRFNYDRDRVYCK